MQKSLLESFSKSVKFSEENLIYKWILMFPLVGVMRLFGVISDVVFYRENWQKTSVNKRQKKLNDLLKIDEQENRRERCF